MSQHQTRQAMKFATHKSTLPGAAGRGKAFRDVGLDEETRSELSDIPPGQRNGTETSEVRKNPPGINEEERDNRMEVKEVLLVRTAAVKGKANANPADSSLGRAVEGMSLGGKPTETPLGSPANQDDIIARMRMEIEAAYAAKFAELEARVNACEVAEGAMAKGPNHGQMLLHALFKTSNMTVYSGTDGEDSPEVIRDFFAAHHDYLDYPLAGLSDDDRFGEGYVTYISRLLKDAARNWLVSLSVEGKRPRSREDLERMLKERFQDRNRREKTLAALRSLVCNNYSSFNAKLNNLVEQSVNDGAESIPADDLCKYFREGLLRGGTIWSELVWHIAGVTIARKYRPGLKDLQEIGFQLLNDMGYNNEGKYVYVSGLTYDTQAHPTEDPSDNAGGGRAKRTGKAPRNGRSAPY